MMKRRSLVFAAAVLLAGTVPRGAGAQSPAAQDAPRTFRAAADVVSVEVSVRRDKRSIGGLTAADFEVLDNGVPQRIDSISYERLPIDLTVLLDVSSSVTGPVLDQLRRSVRQLKADLTAADRLKLVAFNMRVHRVIDFGTTASTDAALDAMSGYGSSAVFDTLAVALTRPPPAGRRQLIMMFSDGNDSSSVTGAEVLLDLARRSTPTVSVVLASAVPELPASPFAPAPAITIHDAYDRLTKETGGTVVYTHTGDDLTSTFRRVLSDFRASYVLYFAPTGVDRAGVHTLDVRVKTPGADVHARRGYAWR